MKPFLVDVPVLILFFNRPQQLSQVFEQVRNARPSKLFLYQDGPRSEHDLPGIKACREVTDQDRKSTRLNSSHVRISYAVFCLKKKKKKKKQKQV